MRRISYIAVLAIAAVTLGVTAHAQTSNAPEFSSAVLDGTTGQLTILFDKNIDLAELDFTKLHIRERGESAGGVSLELYDDTVTVDVSYPDSPSDSFNRGFDGPYGITINGTDHIFVANTGNHTVTILHPNTTRIKDIGIDGSSGSSNEKLNRPVAVATNSTGHIFVADLNNRRVQIFYSNGSYADTIDKARGSDNLGAPNGVAIDSNDRIIVSAHHRVDIFDSGGSHIDRIGGSQNNAIGQLADTDDVTVDSNDRIIVAQNVGQRVDIFTPDGEHETRIKTTDPEPDFRRPFGVVTDSNDRIFVADQQSDNVYIFSPDGVQIDRIRNLVEVHDVALDSADRLYVTGSFDEVRVFNPISADIRLMLDDDALDTISNMANPVLDIEAGAVRTVEGDTIAASIDNPLLVPDTRAPEFQLAKLYNTTGEFSIYLDEQVNPFSTDPTKLHIREQGDDTGGLTLTASHAVRDDSYDFDSHFATNATDMGQVGQPSDIAVNSKGEIIVADSENHCIKIFHTNDMITHLGKNDPCGTGDSNRGNDDREFGWPRAVAVTSDDYILVADTHWDRVQVLHPNGTNVLTFGSNGSGARQFYSPQGIAYTSDGSIVIADTNNHRVQIWRDDFDDPIGATDSNGDPVAGSGPGEFENPTGVAVDSTDRIIIADRNNHRVQILYLNGTHIHSINATDAAGNSVAGSGPGAFNSPYGVDVGPDDKIAVTERNGDRVQVFYPNGSYITEFNSGAGVQFNEPRGVAFHGDDILVADTGNDYIHRFVPSSDSIMHIIDDITTHLYQSAGSSGTDNGQFRQPSDMAIHDGRTYIVDSANHRLQILGPGSDPISIGNTIDDGKPAEGTGNGHFKWPRGIDVDSAGRILVSDTNNNRIQIFDSDGGFTGNITAPGMLGPHGIDVDNGRIFVAARNNNIIQIFDSSGVHTHTINGSSIGGFNRPNDVAAGSGMIAVADTKKDRIVIFDSEDLSHVRTFDTAGGADTFDEPRGITIDNTGLIWVSDTKNHRIQVFDRNGAYIAGFGSEGAGDMQFIEPRGIMIDTAGRAWVADSGNDDEGNHRIQTFTFSSDGIMFNLTSQSLSMVNDMNDPELDIDVAAMADPAGNPIEQSYDNQIITDMTAPVIDTASIRVVPDSGTIGYGGQLNIIFSASATGLSIHSNSTINGNPIKNDTLSYDADTGNYTITYTVSRGEPDVADSDPLPASIILYDAARNPSNTITSIPASMLKISGSEAAVTLKDSFDPRTGELVLNFSSPVNAITGVSELQITDPAGNIIASLSDATLETDGVDSYGFSSRFASTVSFNDPEGIAFNATGHVFIADANNHRVLVFDRNGTLVDSLGKLDGDGNPDESNKDGYFDTPYGVAFDSAGRLIVADAGSSHRDFAGDLPGNNRVQILYPNGIHIHTIGNDDQTGGSGKHAFREPRYLDVDSADRIIVADRQDGRDSSGPYPDRVQIFHPNGTLAMSLNNTNIGANTFDNAFGIAVDSRDRILVTNFDLNNLLIFDSNGTLTDTFASRGTGYGQLREPRDLVTDAMDRIFIADARNHRVQIFGPDGIPLNITFGSMGTGPGQFNGVPSGLAFDSTGRLFVSSHDDRVQIFEPFLSELTFTLSDRAVSMAQAAAGGSHIDVSLGSIRTADGLHFAMPYRAQLYTPAPDESDDGIDSRVTVEVAVPETPDRSTVHHSGRGGSSIIISDPPIVQNPDEATSVLHRVYWETSNDMITLYVVTSTDGSEPDVSLMTPDSGTITAKISDSQPYPGRILYEAEISASNSFAQVYVDGVSRHILLDAPDGDVSVTLYDGPDMTTSPDTAAEESVTTKLTPPEPVTEPKTPPIPEPVDEPVIKDDIQDVEPVQVVDPEPPADNVQVPDDGGCLIATAAYGTELAPQVQLLREIRDGSLLQTHSGTAFMGAFNNIYYAFSPTIADLQRENPVFREATKLLLTPMLYTLNIMSMADDEASVLGLGLSVIALNVGMYVVAPAFAGYTVYKHRKNV